MIRQPFTDTADILFTVAFSLRHDAAYMISISSPRRFARSRCLRCQIALAAATPRPFSAAAAIFAYDADAAIQRLMMPLLLLMFCCLLPLMLIFSVLRYAARAAPMPAEGYMPYAACARYEVADADAALRYAVTNDATPGYR